MNLKQSLVNAWYEGSPWLMLLQPIARLFEYLVVRRRLQFIMGHKVVRHVPVPVIIVGNITVGGAGKTPLVVHLVEQLRLAGFKPGVISRGYGGDAKEFPLLVNRSADVKLVGDEPHLIVQRTGVPMAIDPHRPSAAQHLLQHSACDVIISDDGLQHYALGRYIEIVVVDAKLGFGNQRCLPAGPLREPLQRLQTTDFLVVNGDGLAANHKKISGSAYAAHYMKILPQGFFEVATFHAHQGPQLPPLVHAVAGIGNPQRFFTQLKRLGFDVIEHVFPDHHDYKASDFNFEKTDIPIVMTEKDAVKCRAIAQQNWYFLKIDVEVDGDFVEKIIDKIHLFNTL